MRDNVRACLRRAILSDIAMYAIRQSVYRTLN